jgi:hypothetical protein
MSGRHIALTAAAALGLAPAASASIMTLFLSTHSSDETAADMLDATVDFSVVGLTLTIDITNDTLAPDEFNINNFWFNGPDGVGLTAGSLPGGWSFHGAPDTFQAAGFGKFDFYLRNSVGETDPSVINPGETVSFVFTLSAPVDVKDFTTAFSAEDPMGAMPAIIAAKFVNGPGDDSAFGATVPTPGVLALMGVAAVVASRPRRRRG